MAPKDDLYTLIDTALSLNNIVDYKSLHSLLYKIVDLLGNDQSTQESHKRADSFAEEKSIAQVKSIAEEHSISGGKSFVEEKSIAEEKSISTNKSLNLTEYRENLESLEKRLSILETRLTLKESMSPNIPKHSIQSLNCSMNSFDDSDPSKEAGLKAFEAINQSDLHSSWKSNKDKNSMDIDLMQTSTPANSCVESKSFRSSESTERQSVVYSMIKGLISDSTSPELMNQTSNNQRLEALERRMNDAEIKYIGLQEELAKISSSRGELFEGSSVEASESFVHEDTEEVKIKLNDLEIKYNNLRDEFNKLSTDIFLREVQQEELSESNYITADTISPSVATTKTTMQSTASTMNTVNHVSEHPLSTSMGVQEEQQSLAGTRSHADANGTCLEKRLNDLEINYKNLQEKLAVTDSIQEKLQEKLSVGEFENILHECRDAARKMDDRIAFNAKVEDFSQKLATLDATMMDQIDHLKNILAHQLLQLEGRIRRMKKIFEDQDPCNAAGGKNKALGDLACISCDRYVTMRLNEQQCLSTVLAKPLSRTTQGCPEKTNKKFEEKKTSDNFREGEKRLAGGKHTIISSSDRQAHMSMRSERAINSNAMRLICIDTQTPSDDGTQRILGGIITGVLASKKQ